ncbi:hypothetical protein [Lactococcus garvieae]
MKKKLVIFSVGALLLGAESYVNIITSNADTPTLSSLTREDQWININTITYSSVADDSGVFNVTPGTTYNVTGEFKYSGTNNLTINN